MTSIMRTLKIVTLSLGIFSLHSNAQTPSIQGTYRAILKHDGKNFYQYALFTLSTVNSGDGVLKISANVRMIFGDWDSNEFLTYDFNDVPMNILTRQISMRNAANDVSFIGYLRDGTIDGDWYSSTVGRVGSFSATKIGTPSDPADMNLVHTVTGHYRGKYTTTNPDTSLPERMTLSLVTTQDVADGRPELVISGNLRLYLGGFDSLEYQETPLKDVQFNFYNRYLTVKTEDWGLTLKGILDLDGTFKADVFADGFGKIGTTVLRTF